MIKKTMQDVKINTKRITNISRKDITAPDDFYERLKNKKEEIAEQSFKEITKKNYDENHNESHDESINIETSKEKFKKPKRINRGRTRKNGSWLPVVFALVLIFGIIYWASIFFENTKVEIENKKETFTLDSKQFNASKSLNTSIPFEIMIVPDEELKTITLTDTEQASTKSKGEITFYNEYSATPQKLLANTYLKDEEGKLYTLDNAVTIPGYTLDKDKKIIPGTVPASASSFLIGDSYNGNPKDFTVNAFKGTTKLNKIYAKATTPFTGGALGLVYTLNANDKGVLNSYAGTSFRNNLYRKVGAEIPSDYILYPNAISFSYNINGDSFFKDKNAQVPIDGTLSAVIIKKSDLSKALISNLLPKISDGEFKEIQVLNPESLKFNFVTNGQLIAKDLNSFDFTLSGSLNMVWNINTSLIQFKLLGISKDSVEDFLKQDPGIKNAIIKLFPPWSKTLPKEVSRIKVLIK